MKLNKNNLKFILGLSSGVFAFALLCVGLVYPEMKAGIYLIGGLLVLQLGALAWLNQQELKAIAQSRDAKYGANSLLTIVLFISIVLVLNFLNFNHFYKKDFTTSKVNSLSPQTIKILSELKSELKFLVFARGQERDQVRGVISNYTYGSSKISVEYIDPDRDPERAKNANLKRLPTLIVKSGTRDTKIEDITEEKLTAAVLKVLKEKPIQVCFLTGHGERGIDQSDANGYSMLKAELSQQNYDSKSVSLLTESKIDSSCNVLVIGGPQKAFFAQEIEVLKSYLVSGGRLLVALDPSLKVGDDSLSELKTLLSTWFIDVKHNLILDPTSRLAQMNATIPLIAVYSKELSIARDLKEAALFPLSSSLDLKPNPPVSLKTWWVAKTTPQAFLKDDFKEIASGKVSVSKEKDKMGSHIVMAAAEGSLNADQKEKAKIVVMTSSQVGMNQMIRHGDNSNLILNALSWLADDEVSVSIRPKDEETQLPTLSETAANAIMLLTLIIIPGGSLLAGIFVWRRRKRL